MLLNHPWRVVHVLVMVWCAGMTHSTIHFHSNGASDYSSFGIIQPATVQYSLLGLLRADPSCQHPKIQCPACALIHLTHRELLRAALASRHRFPHKRIWTLRPGTGHHTAPGCLHFWRMQNLMWKYTFIVQMLCLPAW